MTQPTIASAILLTCGLLRVSYCADFTEWWWRPDDILAVVMGLGKEQTVCGWASDRWGIRSGYSCRSVEEDADALQWYGPDDIFAMCMRAPGWMTGSPQYYICDGSECWHATGQILVPKGWPE